MQYCKLSLVSEIAAISGVRDGHIAIANRKNRCDFGALRLRRSEFTMRVLQAYFPLKDRFTT